MFTHSSPNPLLRKCQTVLTKASSSEIILLSLVILLLTIQNIPPVPPYHCWSLVLAAVDTGLMSSLAFHNRDPNKGAKKPHARSSILSHHQWCNHTYQTLDNRNIHDLSHSKHRNQTSSKIPHFKHFSAKDKHRDVHATRCINQQDGLTSMEDWGYHYKHYRTYLCTDIQPFCFFPWYCGKQRTGKGSCLNAS